MKRIVNLIALSALIISTVSIQAGFNDSVRKYGSKAAQELKKHPYMVAATAAVAFCSASIACNEYAKNAISAAQKTRTQDDLLFDQRTKFGQTLDRFYPHNTDAIKELPFGTDLHDAIERYNASPRPRNSTQVTTALGKTKGELDKDIQKSTDAANSWKVTLASYLGFVGKGLDKLVNAIDHVIDVPVDDIF